MEIDLVFEGKIHAIYVNNQQVSSSTLRQYLADTEGDLDVLYKIAPTKMYVGEKQDLIELRTTYNRYNTCSDLPYGPVWGAYSTGKVHNTGHYTSYLASEVAALIKAAEAYALMLNKHSGLHQSEKKLVKREAETIRLMLGRELIGNERLFSSYYTDLEGLPIELLETRFKFLYQASFMSEAAKTQAEVMALGGDNPARPD